ncbi:MAG: hypothetical protein UT94_C0024G0015 [Candidatus Uhrbacteria bacterium GW2011_GWF2_40_263]|nr:MAG: hypothetical protein UT94_C0024G0015 [Candidatus Uhrbacteria bacterium GW2011_GWF2_40_263]
MRVFYELKKQNSPICYTVYQVRHSRYTNDHYDIYAKTVMNGDEKFEGYNLAFKTIQSAIEFINA